MVYLTHKSLLNRVGGQKALVFQFNPSFFELSKSPILSDK
jgi:hypothetical protein